MELIGPALTYGSSFLGVMATGMFVLRSVTDVTPSSVLYSATHRGDPLSYRLASCTNDLTAEVNALSGAQGESRQPVVHEVIGRIKSREAALIVLHGKSGVGKTAILEEVTKELASDMSQDGRKICVLRLDTQAITRGTGFKSLLDLLNNGALSDKLEALFADLIAANQAASKTDKPLYVLYIDEIEAVLRSGVFKKFIEQTGGHSNLILIGATTTDELRASDPRQRCPALVRRMHIVEIPPLNAEETASALFQRFEQPRFTPKWSEPVRQAVMRGNREFDRSTVDLLVDFCLHRHRHKQDPLRLLREILNAMGHDSGREAVIQAMSEVTGLDQREISEGRYRVVPNMEAVKACVLFAQVDQPSVADPSRSVSLMGLILCWKRVKVSKEPALEGTITVEDVLTHREVVLRHSRPLAEAELVAEEALLRERGDLLDTTLPLVQHDVMALPSGLQSAVQDGEAHIAVDRSAPLVICCEAPIVATTVGRNILRGAAQQGKVQQARYLSLKAIEHLFQTAKQERSRSARLLRRLEYFLIALSEFLSEARQRPGSIALFATPSDAKWLLDQLYPPPPPRPAGAGSDWEARLTPMLEDGLDRASAFLEQVASHALDRFGVSALPGPKPPEKSGEASSSGPSAPLLFGHPAITALLSAIRAGEIRLLVAMDRREYDHYCAEHRGNLLLTPLILSAPSLSESRRFLECMSKEETLPRDTLFQAGMRLAPYCDASSPEGVYQLVRDLSERSKRAGKGRYDLSDLITLAMQHDSSLRVSSVEQILKGASLWSQPLISLVDQRPNPTDEAAEGVLQNTLITLYHSDHPAIFIVEESQLRRHLIRDEVVARIPAHHAVWKLDFSMIGDFLAGGDPESGKRLLQRYVCESLECWSQEGRGNESIVLIIEHHEILNDDRVQQQIAEIAKEGKISLIYLCTAKQFEIPESDSLGRGDLPPKRPGAADLFRNIRQAVENPLGLIAGNNDLIGNVRRWFAGEEERPDEPNTEAVAPVKAKVALPRDEVRYLQLPSIARWEIVRMLEEQRVGDDLDFTEEGRSTFIALAHAHLNTTHLALENGLRNYRDLQARAKQERAASIDTDRVLDFFAILFHGEERDDLKERAGLETGRASQMRRKAKKIATGSKESIGQYVTPRMMRNISIAAAAFYVPKVIWHGVHAGATRLSRLISSGD